MKSASKKRKETLALKKKDKEISELACRLGIIKTYDGWGNPIYEGVDALALAEYLFEKLKP